MNRMEEYSELLCALEHAPSALEGTVQRAAARARRMRWSRRIGAPLGSAAAVFAAFMLLVNVYTPFALACSRVPLLKELAAAVAFSPSLKAAVENDFVQYVGQTRQAGGISMTVEYLIVDQKQLNIYYSVSGPAPGYEIQPQILDAGGSVIGGFGMSWSGWSEKGSLENVTVDFTEGDMPEALQLECALYPLAGAYASEPAPAPAEDDLLDGGRGRGEPAAILTFQLTFDTTFTTQGEVLTVGEWINLDGQRIYVDTVEIYPTHIRLQLEDDPDNTAWLRGLEFYLEDERGNCYEKISNGISATGSADSPFFPSHRLESSYFGDAEHLTVHITGAEWLDKDNEYAEINLTGGGSARGLPDCIRLAGAKETAKGVELVFMVDQGSHLGNSNFQSGRWLDPEGGEHWIEGSEFSSAEHDEPWEYGDYTIPAGWGYTRFTLEGCRWDTVRLALNHTRYTELAEAVSLEVK